MNIFFQYTIKIKKLINNLKNKGKIDLPSNLDSVIVDIPPKNFLGDISCNVAMIISKINKKNPIDIANLISNEIKDQFDEVDEISVAKPGFLNLKFINSFWNQFLKEIIQNKNRYGIDNQNNKKNYLIEFVSANPTGPLHVGHCRGAILGDVISNILEWNGYDVEREYYYNNAGRQMQKLGESVKSRYLELLGEDTEFPEDGYEGEYIIDIARKLEETDGKSLKDSSDISPFKNAAEENIFQNIEATLNRIGLKFDKFFNENTLYESGAIDCVVKSLWEKGLVYEKEGATWFKATKAGRDQDRVIIKSSGEPTYRLPDIAYHRNKFERGYDFMVDILGADHMDAYPDVLAGVEQLGCDTNKVRVRIHQFVTLMEKGEAVKMSTRKAQYVTLDDLIDEVGTDVVRYFFLMR